MVGKISRGLRGSTRGTRKGTKLTKKAFTSGFAKKSFLGSAFPSVRQSAPRTARIVGSTAENSFKTIDNQSKLISKGSRVKKF